MSYEQRKLMGLTNSYSSLEEVRKLYADFLSEGEGDAAPAAEPRKGIAPTPLKVKPLKIPKIRKRIDPGNTISFKSLLHKQMEQRVQRLREMLALSGNLPNSPYGESRRSRLKLKRSIGEGKGPRAGSKELTQLSKDAVKAGRVRVDGGDVHLDGNRVRVSRMAKALRAAHSRG